MKKILKTIFVLVAIICVFAFISCSDYIPRALPSDASSSGDSATSGDSGTSDTSTSDTGTSSAGGSALKMPEGFVEVKGETITGQPNWAKDSKVFISGRTITIPTLWVSDHEVTQAEYKAVMGSVPSGQAPTSGVPDNNPVNSISWYDALVYCNKRSMKEGLNPCYTISGKTDPDEWGTVPTSNSTTWNNATFNFTANGYRLPTEAEWEYLARGKEAYTYSGSDIVGEVAWYTDNTNDSGTKEVKTKQANAFALYDMSGNVCEWCWDWFYGIDTLTPSTGPASGSYRVGRGGIWYGFVELAAVASRFSGYPYSRYDSIGLRVVRSAK